MNVQFSKSVPDDTYFNRGNCEPVIKGDMIIAFNGYGTSMRWGTPGVSSTIVVKSEQFVAIHVGFHHKYRGGQFWRYYRQVDGEIKTVLWKSLDESERLAVLDGWVAKAPNWADCPGKLKRDYIRPGELSVAEILDDGRMVGYKYLIRGEDGVYRSPIFRDKTAWENNCLAADVTPAIGNTNGIYAVKSKKDPALYSYRRPEWVLVKLAVSGTIVEHQHGLRAEFAEIVEEL